MDTRLERRTNFHPKMDGKIEVVNRIVVQLLRGYYGKYPKSWEDNIAFIEHSYNRKIYSYTNKYPFEICYGFLPPSPFDCVFDQQKDDVILVVCEEKKTK